MVSEANIAPKKLQTALKRCIELLSKYGWAAVLVMLLGFSYFASDALQSRQREIRLSASQNVSAYALRAVVEFQDFERALQDTSPAARKNIDTTFDILVSRVNGFKLGSFHTIISANPETVEKVEHIQTLVSRIDAVLLLKDEAFVDHINPFLAPLKSELTDLASLTHVQASLNIDAMYFDFEQLRKIFSVLIIALTALGLALFVKLLRQNHRMNLGKSELTVLAKNLEMAKREVEQAHSEVTRSNENLKRRNKILQLHDVEIQTSNQRFDAALNNITQGLLMVDGAHRLIICNERFREIFQLSEAQTRTGDIVGKAPVNFAEIFAAELQTDVQLEEEGDFARLIARQNAMSKSTASVAFTFETETGKIISISQKPIPEGGWVATYEDITQRQRSEERITHLAHHDPLTNLPNRIQLRNRMQLELEKAPHHKSDLTLFYMDLDHFKSVNDTFGHSVGDMLLTQVSARLQTVFGAGNLVFRIGGDEFAAMHFGKTSKAHLGQMCQTIIAALRETFFIESHQLRVGICIGLARVNAQNFEFDTLITNADLALFQAKKSGRNTYRFFEPSMKQEIESRRSLEFDIETGIREGQFALHYQPIVDANTLEIVCFEALLRWNHPTRGPISPGQFIPVAEESGLIVPLGEWALRQACKDASAWKTQTRVAVNLSAVQFKSGQISKTVFSALAAARLAPHLLELEITESILLQDSEETLATLHQLRSFDIRISMDDFGTGYSSLSYLRSFPFDKIKIDRSFITEVSERDDCRAIVRTIVELGRSLKMVTLAEGVETKEQFEAVKDMGCNQIQGFYFGSAVPNHEIPALFQKFSAMNRAA